MGLGYGVTQVPISVGLVGRGVYWNVEASCIYIYLRSSVILYTLSTTGIFLLKRGTCAFLSISGHLCCFHASREIVHASLLFKMGTLCRVDSFVDLGACELRSLRLILIVAGGSAYWRFGGAVNWALNWCWCWCHWCWCWRHWSWCWCHWSWCWCHWCWCWCHWCWCWCHWCWSWCYWCWSWCHWCWCWCHWCWCWCYWCWCW